MTNKKTNQWMIDPQDAVMLLIDHQTGLFQVVRDMDQNVLRANVTALAKVSYLGKIPTFTSASEPNGPNGPLIHEIHECNPDAIFIGRTGQINVWDHQPFVDAIEKTGRKTLVIAGTLTSVCMTFPVLSALAEGYKVFCVIDASGNWSKMATEITIARIAQAGGMPIDTFAVVSEIMHTWNRPDAMDFASIFIEHLLSGYSGLIESYDRAQSAAKGIKYDIDKPATK